MAWRATWAHSRAVPYWVASGADGLDGICEASGIPALAERCDPDHAPVGAEA